MFVKVVEDAMNTVLYNFMSAYYEVYYDVLHLLLDSVVEYDATGNMKKNCLHESTRENSTGVINAGEVEGHALRFQGSCSHYLHSLTGFKTRYDTNNKMG